MAQEHRATALPYHACSAVMGKQWDGRPRGWPVVPARVFVLHRVFTQNTSGPLRTRSAHPSNLLRRQRQSVPLLPPLTPHHPEQHLTQSDPPATHRKLLSAVLNGASVLPQRRTGAERSSVSRLSHRRSWCQPVTTGAGFSEASTGRRNRSLSASRRAAGATL